MQSFKRDYSANVLESLAEPKSYLAAIVESSGDAIISKNLDGVLISWNSAAERIFGYTAMEAIGQHISMLIPKERLSEEEIIISRLEKGESIQNYETVRLNKQGRRLDMSITLSPIRDSAGNIIGASKVARDITEQNRLNVIVTSQKIALEQAMQGLSMHKILEGLLLALEANLDRRVKACILLLDPDGKHLRFGAAPSLPDDYNKASDGLPVGPLNGTCGAAAFHRKIVIVSDIATDPIWSAYSHLALPLNLRACWSRPLFSIRHQLLGTFALYYDEPRQPTQEDMDIVEYFSRTAGIIIERHNEAAERQRIEETLSEETQTLEMLNRLSKLLSSSLDVDAIVRQTTEVLTMLTDAQYGAFYYNRLDEEGKYYDSYTLSSITPAAQKSFIVPRQTALFANTFKGNILRINDLSQDPVYNKMLEDNSIPESFRPIRSCLTIPVISRNGNVLGGLFFGHSAPSAFDDRAVRIAESAASYAAVSIDNAQLYQQIKESEQKWKALTEAMPQLVWVDRADGWCEYLSAQWQEYSGIPVSELWGHGWLNLLHPEDRPRTAIAWEDAVADRAAYDLDYRIRAHNGSYRWFRVRGVPIRDEKGKILKWYGTCTDIQELVESRDAAEAASIAKTEFLANMSHEIRTPMNAVVGLANILALTSPLSDRQQEFIKTLQLSASAMLDLINDLLDISKIEARTVELEHVPFSIPQIVAEVVEMMAMKAREKGLTFESDSDCVASRKFMGDPTRLRQIIMNLCSNALKFTEKGGVKIIISCEQTADPAIDNITFCVRDTGIGIAPNHIQTIFDKFVQADSSINRKYGGTGLGLAITKTLAQLMGGSVHVVSTLGEGSEFSVTLPLYHDNGHTGTQMEMLNDSDIAQNRENPLKILLVEDYAPNVLVATTFLEEFGYLCDVASNGLEAVKKVQSNTYLLVLMDVQMPGMNGMDATRAIREYEATTGTHVPIVGMTAHALQGDKDKCLDAGMDDYIAKPFDPPMLRDKIALHARKTTLSM